MPSPTALEPAEAARLLQRYVKQYGAGAFATPSARELAAAEVSAWAEGSEVTVAVSKTLRKPSRRRAWNGEVAVLPAGVRIITHLGRTPNGPLPDLAYADFITAHPEDLPLAQALAAGGRAPYLTLITAASEMLTIYGPPGAGPGLRPSPIDSVTVARVPIAPRTSEQWSAMRAEVAAAQGWADDFPLYSDGSWAALSLKGYRPDDPSWGVKPLEMGPKWLAAHPGAEHYQCDWTTLAARCPEMLSLIEATPWFAATERVRLMRIAAPGRRPSVLRRHSDVTDRYCGTRDGCIGRIMIPLCTHPEIHMQAWALDGRRHDVHLAPDQAWYLDARKPHAVVHPVAGVDRIHLAVDVVMSPSVREAILAGVVVA